MLPEPQPLPDPILLDSVERILYVASDKRQHPDMPEGENLYESAWGFQVRETPNTEWQLYDRPIYDFDYEKKFGRISTAACSMRHTGKRPSRNRKKIPLQNHSAQAA